MFTLRPYQKQASDIAVEWFKNPTENALMILPTGSGKSLVVADIANRLDEPVLVFCPSKEILEQNYAKMCSYGVECSMYSASVRQKVISRITFASIGSVKSHTEDFKHFRYVIVDEAHKVSSEGGLYKKFFDINPCKVLGLTATPYRLVSDVKFNWREKKIEDMQSKLVTLTSEEKPIFKSVIFNLQVKDVKDMGFLADLEYYNLPMKGWNLNSVRRNSTGTDYKEDDLRAYYDKTHFNDYTLSIVNRLMNPKDGHRRNGILVFVRFVEDAEYLCQRVFGSRIVIGETPKNEREDIIEGFKSGRIPVVFNVTALAVGFDFPALDTIVLARPTLSLALYYQALGRALRPDRSKRSGWIVDLCGTYERFGKVEDIQFMQNNMGEWNVVANNRLVTNCIL